MNVYFISGLGADKRAFQYLQLDADIKVHHLEWFSNNKNETIEQYAQRMAEHIDATQPFCLVGLSFGGIVANEIAKFVKPDKLFLLSTAKTRSELPLLFRIAGTLGLHHLMPIKSFFKNKKMVYRFFGAKSEREQHLLDEILKDSDPNFIVWAIDKIAKWKNTQLPEHYLHLHGDKDIIFPIKYIKNCKKVEEGTHLMVVKKFRAVSESINGFLLDNE